MNKDAILGTAFAPAGRADRDLLAREAGDMAGLSILQKLYDALEIIVLILNEQRQIVFANKKLMEFLKIDGVDRVIGQRPGEAFGCVHASENKSGCGTTEFCSQCGAVGAILASQAGKLKISRECRILRVGDQQALDLMVTANPFRLNNTDYTIFAVEDIADKNRRRFLERIFFHDIMNTAVGVRALSEILPDAPETEKPAVSRMINNGANTLVLEIVSQRELTAIEKNELVPKPEPVKIEKLFQKINAVYQKHDVSRGKRLVVNPVDPEAEVITDATLLGRVLSNMVKNALEASTAGETVTVGFELLGPQEARFFVHNPGVMPREVQLQVFQRSFSTKGAGRGLGTYSIKLITDRYLHGRVSFSSAPGKGTSFFVVVPLTPPPA